MIYSKLTKDDVIQKAKKAKWRVKEENEKIICSRQFKDEIKIVTLQKVSDGYKVL